LDSQVFISGEVKYPGYYVVGQEGVTLREIIERAGGFTESASLAEARVVRQKFIGEGESDPEFDRLRFVPVADRTELDNQYFIMKSREKLGQMSVDLVELFIKGNEAHNIRLLPGDVIDVPILQQTVTVSGAVAQPGAVIFDSTYTVWDYIDRSGGFGWRASRDVLVIKALSGEKERAKDVTQIQPGDRIWVRENPVRDYWTIFTQSMAVIGQVATVVLLFVSITK
jgi:protein involved in polysaccharide export with SLBB domain